MKQQSVSSRPECLGGCWSVRAMGVLCLAILGMTTAPSPCGALGVANEKTEAERESTEMAVTGRVVGADGKPVAGCRLAVLTRYYRRSEKPEGTSPLGWHTGIAPGDRVSAMGESDAEGRFRLTGAGYSAAQPTLGALLIASAPGHGLTVQLLDHVLARHQVTVTLLPEHVVCGLLVDAQGKPAAGVEVRVHIPPHKHRVLAPGLTGGHASVGAMLGGHVCYKPPDGSFWPKLVVTDDQGRFLVRGLGPGKATLDVSGDHIAPNRFGGLDTVDPQSTTEVSLRLKSAPLLEGRVTEEGSGKPVAGARLIVMTGAPGREMVEVRTDKDGRYAVRPFPANNYGYMWNLEVVVHPPEGSRCLILRKCGTLADKNRQELNLSLPVGVALRGQAREAGSGKPVAGARVQYRQRHANNPFLRKGSFALFLEEGHPGVPSTLETAISGADGRFQLAVAPGPGHLFVLGPTLEYVPVATTLRELEGGPPGSMRYYPHAMVPLDIKPNAEPAEVVAQLRRGVTVRGRVVGLDGKPVTTFIVLCRSYIPTGWNHWNHPGGWVEGRNGQFELPGCDSEKPITAYFFDNEHQLGTTAELSARQKDDEGTTVRLEPCGKAEVLSVDRDGEPLPYCGGSMLFQFDPGTYEPFNTTSADRPLEANWFVWGVYGTGEDGKGTVSKDLIPGATYVLISTKMTGPHHDRRGETFTVKAGKTVQVRVVDEYKKAPTFVDLQPKANQHLKDSFPGRFEDNDLAALKQGKQGFPIHWGGGTPVDPMFNIGPGLILLANKQLKGKLPEMVEGIKVGTKFNRLRVLHATVGSVADGTVIAKYVVRYEDKTTETVEVVYGTHLRDWWHKDGDKEPTRANGANVTWKGSNKAAKAKGNTLWLFLMDWKNPHPDKKVVSIDLVSTLTESAPFVLAITVEKE